MNKFLPKTLTNFLKKPNLAQFVCIALAVGLALFILRYFKVIEGMASNMMREGNTGFGFDSDSGLDSDVVEGNNPIGNAVAGVTGLANNFFSGITGTKDSD